MEGRAKVILQCFSRAALADRGASIQGQAGAHSFIVNVINALFLADDNPLEPWRLLNTQFTPHLHSSSSRINHQRLRPPLYLRHLFIQPNPFLLSLGRQSITCRGQVPISVPKMRSLIGTPAARRHMTNASLDRSALIGDGVLR